MARARCEPLHRTDGRTLRLVVALGVLMIIEDLLTAPGRREFAAQPEMDPLSEPGALQEAQLLDVRVHALTASVALLFDLRVALQLRMGNTALLVAHGVTNFTWDCMPRETRRTAWMVVGSEPRIAEKDFALELFFVPDADLSLQATSAEFYVGDVVALAQAPPDYGTDDDATIRAQLADWASPFAPLHAVFLDPAPSSEG